jgi:hypothetical protein
MNKEITLKQCEAVILEGLEAMDKVNRAFSIIKEMKLYYGEYKSFNNYCKTKWDVQNKYQHLELMSSCFGSQEPLSQYHIKRRKYESRK